MTEDNDLVVRAVRSCDEPEIKDMVALTEQLEKLVLGKDGLVVLNALGNVLGVVVANFPEIARTTALAIGFQAASGYLAAHGVEEEMKRKMQ